MLWFILQIQLSCLYNGSPTSLDLFLNVEYKFMSKLPTNRLKPLLHKIFLAEQGAFVPGHNMNESILLKQEILHSMEVSPSATKTM